MIHPIIVHFPIVLIFSVFLFGVLSLFFSKKREQFKELMFWNLILGTIGAIASVIAGIIAVDTLVHNDEIHEILETHQLYGIIITIVLVIVSVWIIIRKSKLQIKELIILVIILFSLSGLIGYTASLGGEMVYENGVGVKPMEQMLLQSPHSHNDTETHHDNQ